MRKEEEFDLSELFGDTLSLRYNIAPQARYINPPKPDNYFDKLVLTDPYELLGEIEFKKREESNKDGTPIQEFYRGANVFITGATGFVGKILIEKLIRSVPHIGHVYLLIRAKKGKSSKERFDHLMEDRVFRRMQAEVPDYAARLTAVDGDVTAPGLGLLPQDRLTLANSVHVVFHSAADVRFIEPLRSAVAINVLGSRAVLELAKEMKHLRAYVHVSTFYSYCVRAVIEENIPIMSVHYQEILNYIESKTDEELIKETPRLLQGWPNTYTFSKALAEQMISEEARDLPACILRPSVVLSTYREPVRGWTDNLYGPTGLLVGAGHGVIHCSDLSDDTCLDVVPVDFVVNCLITMAWSTALRKKKDLPVYNFACKFGLQVKTFFEFGRKTADAWPFSRSIWYPSAFYTDNYYLYEICWWLLHRIPGLCLDKLAEITGDTPVLTKIYKRLETLRDQLHYFAFREWTSKNNNVMDLWWQLSEDDKKIFNFDVRDVDFKEYTLVSKLGIRYYFLKEKMEDIPAAMLKNKRLYWLHNFIKFAGSLLALKLLAAAANALPF